METAVRNALNNLTGYPHQRDDEFQKWTGVGRAEMVALLEKWRQDGGAPASNRTAALDRSGYLWYYIP